MTANIPAAPSLKFPIPRRSIRGYIFSGALLIAYIGSTGIASIEGFKRQMSSQDMRAILKSKSNGSPDVSGVNVFDSDGMLVNSSTWPRPAVRVADRAYFK